MPMLRYLSRWPLARHYTLNTGIGSEDRPYTDDDPFNSTWTLSFSSVVSQPQAFIHPGSRSKLLKFNRFQVGIVSWIPATSQSSFNFSLASTPAHIQFLKTKWKENDKRQMVLYPFLCHTLIYMLHCFLLLFLFVRIDFSPMCCL